MAKAALKPEHERFVGEYLISLNAVQAYRIAYPGTTYRAAAVQAHRLLKRPNIRAEIRAARRARQRRTRVTADKVLMEVAGVAFADVWYLFDDDGRLREPRQVPIQTRRALASVKVARERVTRRVTRDGETVITETVREEVVEYKFANKLDALGRLAQLLGVRPSIPPLAVLLDTLPAALAASVRAALAASPDRTGS